MHIIDITFLVSISILSSCLILIPKVIKGILNPFIAIILLLALMQFLLNGLYKHYLPSYLLILFILIITIFFKENTSQLKKRFLNLTIFLLLMASLAPWSILVPVPKLIQPQGDYQVGTRYFRWVDSSRSEQLTADLNDKRNVVVQAWYPTEESSKGSHSDYLDGLGSLPEKIGPLPKWVFDHYDQVNTYGLIDAPISKVQARWPVVIFLTGNGASRAFYTSLISGLASHGYVVLAIDHPYEAMVVKIANGKIVTNLEKHSNDQPNLMSFMEDRLHTRIIDVQFVINQLDNIAPNTDDFFSCLDQNSIVITGHSLGGASAAVAMANDSRIKAAANIDGTLYGELPKPNGARPFLLIESKKEEGDHFLRYQNGNNQLFKQFGGGYRYEIPEADHYSFTDAPFMLALPARFMASQFQGFGQIPNETHNATINILNTFFLNALAKNFKDMDSIVKHNPVVIEKKIVNH
jgi:dienelactone hydrolase